MSSWIEEAYRLYTNGRHAAAQQLYQEGLLKTLKSARELQLYGYLALMFGDIPRAKDVLRRSVKLDRSDAQSQLLLGLACRRSGDLKAAVHAFQHALRLNPGWTDATNNLALTYDDLQQYDAAIRWLQRGLQSAPQDADLNNALGSVLAAVGRPAEALPHYRQAIEQEPAFAPFQYNLGEALLQSGDWETGWRHYERRLDFRDASATPSCPAPFYDGDVLTEKQLLIWCEQGYGDAVQFVRYIPSLAARGARVTLRCPPPLQRLMATLPGVQTVLPNDAQLPEVDIQLPVASLPRFFSAADLRGENFRPYLHVAPLPAPTLISTAASPRVGLVWAGNPNHRDDHKRSIPGARCLPLIRLPEISWFSLQVGTRAGEIHHPRLTALTASMDDFLDTAGLMAHLDLVISVDTAAAHLAGALGRPVWLLADYAGDWRWREAPEDSPWYPSMRIFRQDRPGDWRRLLKQVQAALDIWKTGFKAPAEG